MKAKFTFTPQSDFINFVDSFGYDDVKLDELKSKLKSLEVYTNSYSSLLQINDDLTTVHKVRGEEYKKIELEITKILCSKNPKLYFEKWLEFNG